MERLTDLIQVCGGPNTHWSLATLPRAIIDIPFSIQFELSAIHRILPVRSEAETVDRSGEYSNRAYWQAAMISKRLVRLTRTPRLPRLF